MELINDLRLRPNAVNEGWHLNAIFEKHFPDVSDATKLANELRKGKVLTPRSRYNISTGLQNLFLYVEFSSMEHGSRFIERLKNHIEKNGGSILD
jgi:hypothetical protein